MQRENKFRAKRDDMSDYNWKYGNVCFYYDEDGTRVAKIQPDEKELLFYTCFANTVGQYTGLKDRNGNEIYEGDIVKKMYKNNRHIIRKVIFKKGMFGIISMKGKFKPLSECKLMNYIDYSKRIITSMPNTFEVIGNIHDNPELLEVE